MPIDPTFDINGNELADRIICQRASAGNLRTLLREMDWSQKIATVQIACHLISCTVPVKILDLKVTGAFSDKLEAALALMANLPPETLAEIAIEILEARENRNE